MALISYIRKLMHQKMISDSVILNYRNDAVIQRFSQEQNLSLAESEECFVEMLRFLIHTNKSNQPCSPSKRVDEMWHTFIIYTKDYRNFCYEYLGQFIDHVPNEVDTNNSQLKTSTSNFNKIKTLLGINNLLPVLSFVGSDNSSAIAAASESPCGTCVGECKPKPTNVSCGCALFFIVLPILFSGVGSLVLLLMYIINI